MSAKPSRPRRRRHLSRAGLVRMETKRSTNLLQPELSRQAGAEIQTPAPAPVSLAGAFGAGRPVVEPASVKVDGCEESLIPKSEPAALHMADDFSARAARVPDVIGEGEQPAGADPGAAADPGAVVVKPAPVFFDPGEIRDFAAEAFDAVAEWRGVDGYRLTDRRAAILAGKLAPVLNRVIHNALTVLPDSAAAAAEANPENVSLVLVLVAVCIPGFIGEFQKWADKKKQAGAKTDTLITGSVASRVKSDSPELANRL